MTSYDWQRKRFVSNERSLGYLPLRAQDMRTPDRDKNPAQNRSEESPESSDTLQRNVRCASTHSSYNSQSRNMSDLNARPRHHDDGLNSQQHQTSWLPVSPSEQIEQPRRDEEPWRAPKPRRNRFTEAKTPPADRRRSPLITPHSEYDIIKPLESRPGILAGGGMNLGIFLIEHRTTRELYVEKRLRMRDDTDRARVKSENSTLYQIRQAGSSPHVVDVIEAFSPPVFPPYCSLILEYCNSGTLKDFVDRYIEERKITPEPFAWHVFAGVTSALCACHYGVMDAKRSLKGPCEWDAIWHLDVKPSNILLTATGKTSAYPRVVLGDFGCAARLEDIDARVPGQSERVYTPDWLPPENERSPYGARSSGSFLGPHTDVWQVGGVIQAMCRLTSVPNQGLVEEERPCGSRFTFALNNVISCCMSRDPGDRPTTLNLVREIKREMQNQGMSF